MYFQFSLSQFHALTLNQRLFVFGSEKNNIFNMQQP